MEKEKGLEERPWGNYTILDEGPGYKVKRIFIKKDERLSLQRHKNRDEHWTFISGTGILTLEQPSNVLELLQNAGQPPLKETVVGPNLQAKILKGLLHRVEAMTDLVFIEVAIGDIDENDIERIEDDYGRVALENDQKE